MPRITGLLFACCLLLLPACSGTSPGAVIGDESTDSPPEADGCSLDSALDELASLETPAGVSEELFAGLKRELARVLTARMSNGRQASEPPLDGRSEAPLLWNQDTTTLTWYYYNTGDYNQDGFVTVSDITPLGQNFDAEGPFDPASALSCIDGTQDGFITVSDITPIGQAFDRSVTGYNVYASSSPDDYPDGATDDNGEAELLGSVAFADATGEASDRKLFAFSVTGAEAGDAYWVRPTDGESEGTASNRAEGGSPVGETQGAVDGISADFWVTYDLELVNGNPAFMYVNDEGETESIYYIRANDALGTDWPETSVLVADELSNPEARMLVLADGSPAIFFTKKPDEQFVTRLHFISASESSGAAWNAAVEADPITTSPDHLAEGLIGGMPAAAFGAQGASEGESRFGLRYITATDATGTTWGDSLYISPETDIQIYPMLAEVNGNPAVGYYPSDINEFRYVRATDAAGTAWSAEQTIFDLGSVNVGESPSLLVNGGLPLMWFSDPNGALFVHVADDADGASWPDTSQFEGRQGFWPQAVVTGPAASDPLFLIYRNWTDFMQLHLLLASDPGSGYAVDWETTFEMREGGDIIGWRRLAQPKCSADGGTLYFAYPSDSGGGNWSLNLVTLAFGAS